jgi:hypothetical protein
LIRDTLQIDELEFLRHFSQNAPYLMWFTGAGAPRSSGLPTAQDLIWDLKRRYYCERENQDIQAHDVRNQGIRARIQSYSDSRGFPAAGSKEEYSYCFELVFGDDYDAQRLYLQQQLSTDKVTLTIGQRALAALMAMGRARLVYTTNFEEVLESAYSLVTGRALSAFHLEGSYAALDALNHENFPIYAKVHGDFRYRSVKNLSADLKSNDAEIQKCFIAAAGRYGLIVAGYSGRDANVMAMFEEALNQPNPFPHGIWWSVPRASSEVAPPVEGFLLKARDKGVKAGVVETGPFDVMLSKLWRQVPDKPLELDRKVRSARAMPMSISLPRPGKGFPWLRTNALPVNGLPLGCGRIANTTNTSVADIFSKIREKGIDAAVPFDGGVIFWGEVEPVCACLEADASSVLPLDIADPAAAIAESTHLKSFYETTLVAALCQNAPVVLRRKGKSFYAVVDYSRTDDQRFRKLKYAVGSKGEPDRISGIVYGLPETHWAEAVELRLEERGGMGWLMLTPDIWIKPLNQRELATDFLRARKLRRYNTQSYHILSAWIELLLGSVGGAGTASVTYAAQTAFPATFSLSTRTSFSRREVGVG